MVRFQVSVVSIALFGSLLFGRDAEAQVRVSVDAHWEWGSQHAPEYRQHYEGYGLPVAVYDVRIPPGHYPPPGECRLWYPGVPPGHQPPPVSCHSLHYVPVGVFVVGADGQAWGPDPRGYWEDDYRDYGWDGDDRPERYKEDPRGSRR